MRDFFDIPCPETFFTRDYSDYFKIIHYRTSLDSPVFLEKETVFGFVRAGEGKLFINQQGYRLQENTLFITNPFQFFRLSPDYGHTLEVDFIVYPAAEIVYMDFSDSVTMSAPTYGESSTPCLKLDEKFKKITEDAYYVFEYESLAPDANSRLLQQYQKAKLFGVCHLLQNNKMFWQHHDPAPLCKRIYEYIVFNCSEKLTEASVAEAFGISKSNLREELLKVSGMNFKNVLKHARLVRSYIMLFQTNIPFSSIAKEAGFSSEGTFYRDFEHHFGTSPAEYRDKAALAIFGAKVSFPKTALSEIVVYILQKFRNQITIKSCAKELYLQESSINAMLKTTFGENASFSKMVSDCRLKFSEGLLLSTDYSIKDIASMSGFMSVHTFIRLFKDRHAMTPERFRKAGSTSNG